MTSGLAAGASALRSEIAAAARDLAAAGLFIGTAGNLSARDEESGLIAITATGVDLSGCNPEQVSVVDAGGVVVAGALAPTSELDLHLRALSEPGVGAVVHTHAPAATAVACVRDALPVLHYQQLLLGGEVPVAPYATFGTPELAASVGSVLAGRNAVLMANHGALTVGASLSGAVEHARLLEWCCRLFLDASVLGEPRTLDADQQHAVVEAAIARDYGRPRAAAPEETP